MAAESDANDDSFEPGEATPVGVKLGSTRTVLKYPDQNGELTTVRSLTCLATYEDAITGSEKALFGERAAAEYPDRVEYMLRSGLPEDDERAELADRYFRELIAANGVPEESTVVYAVPTMENDAGLENLTDVIESSAIGGVEMRSYPESLCGAIPALGDGVEAVDEVFIAVNMGSTNLEASAYRRGDQLVPFSTGSVTGNDVDRRIVSNVEEETQGRVHVDLTTAREYKEEHGDFDAFEPFSDVVQQPGGGSHEFTIEDSVQEALNWYLDAAVDAVANEFLPELANDYMKPYQLALANPIALTGGMACIPGMTEEFEKRLSAELDRDVEAVSPDEPDLAAAEGAHRIAERLAGR
ncbi:rod shape-determining protein [Halorarum halophilum]|uniref:Rod shape-determining protein n=1 Tax=Halorarum halophilum TaxID=2743090 RepID=A0A7D5GGP0_9EURY|nr:rod shape-determining protein [Halobaculum halophilum]QLG29268.1 rod shape-determining protein [Halobaculum halophilum]